jgi:hypothetical protein
MLAGGDDQLWASCTLAKIASDRLARSGHTKTHAYDFVCYPDTGHLLFQPGGPTTDLTIEYVDGFHIWMDCGGTPVGYGHAARDADAKIRRFLEKTLGD